MMFLDRAHRLRKRMFVFPGITVYFIGRGLAGPFGLGPDRFADRLPLLTCSMCFKEVKMDSKEGWDNRSDIFRIVWY